MGFEKFMRALFLSPPIREGYEGRTAQLRQVSRSALALAREIEKLLPAVDVQVSPENAKYPWANAQAVISPCDHDFSRLSLLRDPGGRTFLKLLRCAVERFDAIGLR
ncbi:MAG: hypothetical protein HY744_18825 [Deltaproteobacteria bacterium]|nr:hypothetical protein [Deltaproteobacteria bacterium]